jgi:hypothetical protein
MLRTIKRLSWVALVALFTLGGPFALSACDDSGQQEPQNSPAQPAR